MSVKTIIVVAFFLITTTGFYGCGGSNDEGTPKVSNIGNNINSLGYYGGNTIFGTKKIVGYWKITNFYGDDYDYLYDFYWDDNYKYNDEYVYYYATDSSNIGSTIIFTSKWDVIATYGVTEDGKKLKQKNLNDGSTYSYEYIKDLTVKRADETIDCIKVLKSSNNEYYLMCKFDGSYLSDETNVL